MKGKHQAKMIRKAREVLGESQSQVAKRIWGKASGATQHFSNLERGVTSIPAKKVLALCKALDIDLKDVEQAAVADFLVSWRRQVRGK